MFRNITGVVVSFYGTKEIGEAIATSVDLVQTY